MVTWSNLGRRCHFRPFKQSWTTSGSFEPFWIYYFAVLGLLANLNLFGHFGSFLTILDTLGKFGLCEQFMALGSEQTNFQLWVVF